LSTLIEWLRASCAEYEVEPAAIYRRQGEHDWPLHANDEQDLTIQLEKGGHFLPLPKEPAALANVIEVSLVGFLLDRLAQLPDVESRRGTERGYPDIEIGGDHFGGGYHAVDVKVARRAASGRQTESRITLYTGNTYFRHPQLQWPGTFRPFQEYKSHLDLIALYTLNESMLSRIEKFEIIVHEAWRIASRQRSSTTREYLGAVTSIEALREGRGEFSSEAEFYSYWRRYNFRVGRAVQRQLDKLLRQQK
jgi:hypothetical protein